MPRSRSRSLESMARSATCWLSRKVPLCLQQAVDQRGLAVVDVRDDRDVADVHNYRPEREGCRARYIRMRS